MYCIIIDKNNVIENAVSESLQKTLRTESDLVPSENN